MTGPAGLSGIPAAPRSVDGQLSARYLVREAGVDLQSPGNRRVYRRPECRGMKGAGVGAPGPGWG
jgi:hypothetical protein